MLENSKIDPDFTPCFKPCSGNGCQRKVIKVTVLTVGYRTYMADASNPIEALKGE